MITEIELINNPSLYVVIYFCMHVVRTLKICSLSKF